jgi:translation initiation factor IF-2
VRDVAFAAVPVIAKDQTLKTSDTKERLSFILKTDVAGSLEALKQSLGDTVHIAACGVGEITESDILLAETMKAKVIGFNLSVPKSVLLLAETHGVRLKSYKIIYELLEDVAKQVEIFEHPDLGEVEQGTAEVVAIFEIRGDRVVGCKIKTGEFARGQQYFFHWKRGEQVLQDVRVKSLKQAKLDVDAVKAPGECGIVLRGNPEILVGDLLTCFTKREII